MTSKLLEYSQTYKPFHYPWAMEIAEAHEKIHWGTWEVELKEDVAQWKSNTLSTIEKTHITQILRLFTQSDVQVGQNYCDLFIPVFKNNEIRNMLSSFLNRECYTKDTEILTNEGWKLIKDLSRQEKVAQYHIESGNISFVKPTDYIQKKYQGLIHNYESKVCSLSVTPNHEIITINPHTNKVTKNKSQSGVWGRNFRTPVAGSIASRPIERLEELRLRTLIAVQADGNIKAEANWCKLNRPNENRVYLHLVKQKKINRANALLSELYSLDPSISLNTSYNENKKATIFSFKSTWAEQFKIKSLENIDIETLTKEEAEIIIDELRYWDSGSNNNDTNFTYYNTNEKAIDKLQAIAALCNYRAIKGINKNAKTFIPTVIANNINKTECIKTCYTLSITSTNLVVYPRRTETVYDDFVYCVTVPDGNIVTRKNGRVVISGNCTHQRAYALLNDTLGLHEKEYSAFLEYKEMANKISFMQTNDTSTLEGIAKSLAQTVCNEGMSLFSAFAMLLNYQRFGKMKGMCTVVEWSIDGARKI